MVISLTCRSYGSKPVSFKSKAMQEGPNVEEHEEGDDPVVLSLSSARLEEPNLLFSHLIITGIGKVSGLWRFDFYLGFLYDHMNPRLKRRKKTWEEDKANHCGGRGRRQRLGWWTMCGCLWLCHRRQRRRRGAEGGRQSRKRWWPWWWGRSGNGEQWLPSLNGSCCSWNWRKGVFGTCKIK